VRAWAAVAVVVLLGASSCGGSDANDVTMGAEQRFEPATISVSVGDTVTWNNEGPEAHTVTAYGAWLPPGAPYFASGGLDSERAARAHVGAGLLGPGERFEFTFEQPGTYRYFCIPHEGSGMKARVVVEG
jgi:plastocyanin